MEDYRNENFEKDLKQKIHQEVQSGRRERLDSHSGRVLAGIVMVVVGGLFFARQAGIEFPYWFYSWEMIVIGIGVYIGARRSFRPGGWMIAIAVGVIFLADDILYDHSLKQYLWPSVVILIGLLMIFRPRRNRGYRWDSPTISSEDSIDAVNIFGGTKKNIISKDFKGGEITNVFGGTDLNLTQSDIQGTAVIDVTLVLGGMKLVVPPHWNIKSEVVCILGGIDDRRSISKDIPEATKVLVLKGTCVMGGIDIKSY